MVPPGGGPRVPYRRVTTFVSVMEDTAGLHRWQQRQLAHNLARRPDLVLAAATTNPADTDNLDGIVDKAVEPASAAATIGTALHTLTERLDRGERVYIPESHRADVAAYQAATSGIEWTAIECFRVLDMWRVAGTADRIGRYRGRLVIADIKTGSIEFPNKFAMQLSVYARSLPYDVGTDRRGPADTGLDLRRGLIVHLPAGQGTCDLYEIDLEKGWEACQLAYRVWQWRSTRGLLAPATADFTEAARNAADIDALRQVWREAHRHNAVTKVFLDTVGKRRQELAATTSSESESR